jgi:hypothetical protein
MLLLTDGTIIAHESDSPKWHRLKPDVHGSYDNGTWTAIPPMPPNSAIPAAAGGPAYGPLFFGSAVLADGTVFIAGGEYNLGISSDVLAATRFDPVTSVWTNLPTPVGWSRLGDVPLCVLTDGRVLLGNIDDARTAFFHPPTGTFTAGPSKGDRCAEESFTLLPDGTVLAVDCTDIPRAEKYVPGSNTWVSAGSTPSTLPQACAGIVPEIGPTVVLPNGHAFVIGATGTTATYIPPAVPAQLGTWQAGPTIVDASHHTLHPIDAPAVLLPNGRVLLAASPAPPCSFPGPTMFFEYDPASNGLSEVTAPSNDAGPCFTGRFLLLPNGQVLFTNQSSTVTIYSPDGAPDPAWKPAISHAPSFMAAGHHYRLSGRQFNGLSQACCYGDDATMATNYPIARLEHGTTVIYCRTAHHSTMGVATGSQIVSTVLSIPSSVAPGVYDLVVIANGIPSDKVPVTIAAALPALAVDIQNGGHFGLVCDRASLSLQLFNVGDLDLIVDQVEVLPSPGDFSIEPLPATPLTIKPGAEVDFTVTFKPTQPGTTNSATVRITSSDPNTPTFDLTVSASAGTGSLLTAVADQGNFGDVCVGSFRDQPLTIANNGSCELSVRSISSSSPDFQTPFVHSFPLTIAPGTGLNLPIRFQPAGVGPASGSVVVDSDDPAGPKVVHVFGSAPAPRLVLLVADHGNFGKACLGEFNDELLTLSNSGGCALVVEAITSSSAEFLTPLALTYPIRIGAGDSLSVPIRFQPTSFGAKLATLSVSSNAPTSPSSLIVSGEAPSGTITVTGSTCFGGVPACTCAERVIAICNVGECRLNVTGAKFKRKNRHWKLINNPFPASLAPGSCLNLVIRYKATEQCPRSQDLILTSDDPVTPIKELPVSAYTVWDRCGCQQCCDDCRAGQCAKRHAECARPCGKPPKLNHCCDDDDDDDDCARHEDDADDH